MSSGEQTDRYKRESWLREKYHGENMSLKEVARLVDRSTATIRNWMMKHGIETRGLAESTTTAEERFWDKVERGDPDECWMWVGGTTNAGYGTIKYEDKTVNANNLVYYFEHGEWPVPKAIHECGKKLCMNPEHLFEGYFWQVDYESNTGNESALSDEEVAEIREKDVPGTTTIDLAEEYGVSKATIRRVLSHRGAYK